VALASARSYVEGRAEHLRRAGIDAEGHAVSGRISSTVVRVAEEAGADVIVMGTTAPRGAARAVLGSTADQVLRTARRPVLLVHQS
jgi:nucleotide-binding universal stress UspA family protein